MRIIFYMLIITIIGISCNKNKDIPIKINWKYKYDSLLVSPGQTSTLTQTQIDSIIKKNKKTDTIKIYELITIKDDVILLKYEGKKYNDYYYKLSELLEDLKIHKEITSK